MNRHAAWAHTPVCRREWRFRKPSGSCPVPSTDETPPRNELTYDGFAHHSRATRARGTRTAQDTRKFRALRRLERTSRPTTDDGVSGADRTIAGFADGGNPDDDRDLFQSPCSQSRRDTTARLLSRQLARQTGRREQTEGERSV